MLVECALADPVRRWVAAKGCRHVQQKTLLLQSGQFFCMTACLWQCHRNVGTSAEMLEGLMNEADQGTPTLMMSYLQSPFGAKRAIPQKPNLFLTRHFTHNPTQALQGHLGDCCCMDVCRITPEYDTSTCRSLQPSLTQRTCTMFLFETSSPMFLPGLFIHDFAHLQGLKTRVKKAACKKDCI